jgi:tetratricopeptide (TPR) repeat protein
VLRKDGKRDEAEQVLEEAEALPPAKGVQPFLLRSTASWRILDGRFAEAAADLGKTVESNPDDDWNWCLQAIVLAYSRDEQQYRKHCQAMLARFGATKDPQVAEQVAEACLLLPAAGADLEAATRLADTTVIPSKEHEPAVMDFFVKSLAEYRQDHFVNAADWAGKALAASDGDYEHDIGVNAILAMACLRSQQTNESRSALGNAIVCAQTKFVDYRDSYFCWVYSKSLLADIFLQEAVATQQKQLGNENPDVAESLNGMTTVLWKLGRLDEAKAMSDEALAINQKIWPNDPARWKTDVSIKRTIGCRIDGGDVVFVFEPAMFGVQAATDAEVHVVGDFNEWLDASDGKINNPLPAWQMQLVTSNRYELRKKLADFHGRPQWQFKFVVNLTQWLDAPGNATNRTSGDRNHNLTLIIPDNPGETTR